MPSARNKVIGLRALWLLLPLFAASCSTPSHIYEPASAGRISTPVIPKIYDENNKGQWQFSGYGMVGWEEHPEGNVVEKVEMVLGTAQYYRRDKFLDFFAGAHVFSGNYKYANHNFNFLGKNIPFYGTGFRVGTHFTFGKKNVAFRPIGVQVLYNYEFGPWNQSLKELEKSTIDVNGVILPNNEIAVYSGNSVVSLGLPLFNFGIKLNEDWYISSGFAFDFILLGRPYWGSEYWEEFHAQCFLSLSYKSISILWNPQAGTRSEDLARLGLQFEL